MKFRKKRRKVYSRPAFSGETAEKLREEALLLMVKAESEKEALNIAKAHDIMMRP